MKLGEKGYTLVEILMITTIVALVANGAMMSVFQVLRNTEYNENQITAVGQVESAGYWIGLDTNRAQSVEAAGIGGETFMVVSWEQSEGGELEETGQYADTLYFAFSGDGGESWGDWEVAFTGDSPAPQSPFSHVISGDYLTNSFLMRFYLSGPDGWIGEYPNEEAYIDNINVSKAMFSDDCTSFDDWDNGADWSVYYGEFHGHHYGDEGDRYLAMDTSLDLSFYQGETVTISWSQRTTGGIDPSDGLYYAFSGDGGETWSSNIEAFHGYPPSSFSATVPGAYLTDDFRVRLYLDYFGGGDENLYIDNIAISVPVWSDDCSSFANWTNGADWDIYTGEFRGHHYGGNESERYLTMDSTLDLTTELFAPGFPLTFAWTTWSDTGGTDYEVTYSIVDGRLMRLSSVDGGAPTQTQVAQYIDPYSSNCQFAGGKLTLTVTAAVGIGPAASTESRQFQILTRPD